MFKIIRKSDIVLFFVLVAIGFVLSLPGITSVVSFGSGSSSGQASEIGMTVEISVAGESFGCYDLSQDKDIEINKNGHYNKVIIKDGTVQIVEASCHNQVCVKQGRINRSNQSIVCLPNRVVVRIANGGIDNDIGGEADVISG